MPEKKKCRTCGKTRSIANFHLQGRGQRRADCKFCKNTREINSSRYASRRKLKRTEEVEPTPMMEEAPPSKRYVVTWAQNATPVNVRFIRALETYCEENDAQLLVIPGRYRNPTSVWNQHNKNDEWWAKEVHPYLFSGRLDLGKLAIYGDISVQPTAVTPLSGFEVFMGGASAIFGHPKIQLETVATAKRRYPRIATTTGACTLENYTDSKAGKKGEAHHVFGAVVIEEADGLFHLRHINAERGGGFIDLEYRYTHDSITEAARPLAFVPGDIHVDKSDPDVLDAVFDAEDSIVKTLRPRRLIFHDVLDFNRRNHHTINDFLDRYDRRMGDTGQQDVVETEVDDAIRFLDERTPDDCQAFVVGSNHDEAFDKWLRTADPRADHVNALFFHETWVKVLRERQKTGTWKGAFQLWYEDLGEGRVTFWDRDEPLKIADIYFNFHGDKGAGGGRPGKTTYAKLGVKTVTGHTHAPGIRDGNVTVGVTGALDMGYNSLPSGWMNSGCLVYANAKRTLLHVIDGRWRA